MTLPKKKKAPKGAHRRRGHSTKDAAKTDRTARRRYEVAMKMYLAGMSTVLDLNAATSEKDSARRGYISAMQNYWTLYYGLRSMTQYDFRHGCSLEHELDIEKIVE